MVWPNSRLECFFLPGPCHSFFGEGTFHAFFNDFLMEPAPQVLGQGYTLHPELFCRPAWHSERLSCPAYLSMPGQKLPSGEKLRDPLLIATGMYQV